MKGCASQEQSTVEKENSSDKSQSQSCKKLQNLQMDPFLKDKNNLNRINHNKSRAEGQFEMKNGSFQKIYNVSQQNIEKRKSSLINEGGMNEDENYINEEDDLQQQQIDKQNFKNSIQHQQLSTPGMQQLSQRTGQSQQGEQPYSSGKNIQKNKYQYKSQGENSTQGLSKQVLNRQQYSRGNQRVVTGNRNNFSNKKVDSPNSSNANQNFIRNNFQTQSRGFSQQTRQIQNQFSKGDLQIKIKQENNKMSDYQDKRDLGSTFQYSNYNPPQPEIDYKLFLDPQGIEMFQQQILKKETDQQLKQMQNRIKLLKLQEQKIQKRNEQQSKKIKEMITLRQIAQNLKREQEQRRQKEQYDLELKRQTFINQKEQQLKQRLRSQQQIKQQQQSELQKLKIEKEQRRLIIKHIKNPYNYLNNALKNQNDQSDGDTNYDLNGEEINTSQGSQINAINFRSAISMQHQKNEQQRKRMIDRQKRLYQEKLRKNQLDVQRNMYRMKELQSIELTLLENVQKQTLYQQEVQSQYDLIMSRGYSKQRLVQSNINSKTQQLGQLRPNNQLQKLDHNKQQPYNIAKSVGNQNHQLRPITQSAFARKINMQIDSARQRELLKSQEQAYRPQSVSSGDVEKLKSSQEAAINNFVQNNEEEHDRISYESQNHKMKNQQKQIEVIEKTQLKEQSIQKNINNNRIIKGTGDEKVQQISSQILNINNSKFLKEENNQSSNRNTSNQMNESIIKDLKQNKTPQYRIVNEDLSILQNEFKKDQSSNNDQLNQVKSSQPDIQLNASRSQFEFQNQEPVQLNEESLKHQSQIQQFIQGEEIQQVEDNDAQYSDEEFANQESFVKEENKSTVLKIEDQTNQNFGGGGLTRSQKAGTFQNIQEDNNMRQSVQYNRESDESDGQIIKENQEGEDDSDSELDSSDDKYEDEEEKSQTDQEAGEDKIIQQDLKKRIDSSDQDDGASYQELDENDLKTHSSSAINEHNEFNQNLEQQFHQQMINQQFQQQNSLNQKQVVEEDEDQYSEIDENSEIIQNKSSLKKHK